MDTIAAIVTAQGTAAVSIIRVSGEKRFDIIQKISKLELLLILTIEMHAPLSVTAGLVSLKG